MISRLEDPGYMNVSGYTATGRRPGSGVQGMPGSFWITGLRVFAWLLFAGTVITGLIIGIGMINRGAAGIGLLVILGSLIAAFLSVAGIMVFLDMALDISEIKHVLRNNKK